MRFQRQIGGTKTKLQQSYSNSISNHLNLTDPKSKSTSNKLRILLPKKFSDELTSKSDKSLCSKQKNKPPHRLNESVSFPVTKLSNRSALSNIALKKKRFSEKALQTSASLIVGLNPSALTKSKEKIFATEKLKVDSSVGTSQEFNSFALGLNSKILKKAQKKLSELQFLLKEKKYHAVLNLEKSVLEDVQEYPLKDIKNSGLKFIFAKMYFVFAKAHCELKSYEDYENSLFWAFYYGEGDDLLIQKLKTWKNLQKEAQSPVRSVENSENARTVLLECVEKLGINYLEECFSKFRALHDNHSGKDSKSDNTKKVVIEKSKKNTSTMSKSLTAAQLKNGNVNKSLKYKKNYKSDNDISKSGNKNTRSFNPQCNESKMKPKDKCLSKSMPNPRKIFVNQEASQSLKLCASVDLITSPSVNTASGEKRNLPFKSKTKKDGLKLDTSPIDASGRDSASNSESPKTNQLLNSSINTPKSNKSSSLPASKLPSNSFLRLAMFKLLPFSTSSLGGTQLLTAESNTDVEDDRISLSFQENEANSVKSNWTNDKLPLPNSNLTLHNENKNSDKSMQKRFFNLIQSKTGGKKDFYEKEEMNTQSKESGINVIKEDEGGAASDMKDMSLPITNNN
ncbi:hypothetical protein HMI54_015103 [Coelomomyces lativittatus]|nr:hypothetical protein HMI56_004867 [Coelomomyces lativittatus]KAJ1512035.1 hypothetical protein HMI55_006380 [Coelomomyces lativittatus]KAJ1513310.1 hypothetical protein HMI54_015103 [Coelomomyces lativittatus]